ncbi:MAG: glycosyltransferase family 2 protein [Methyloprofundus sp.]|nr:glycosyltransferase family 2 protein [Methyloprofundus sp.]
MARVSICIPTYNGSQYLEACLDSVLTQTYEDIEILIIDDRSTDNTIDIVKHYAALDQRIRLIENEHNLGLVNNWLKCIEHATGLWIKFLFQDDLMTANCISRLVASGEENDCPIVFCQRELIVEAHSNSDVLEFLRGLPSWESAFANLTLLTPEKVCATAIDYPALNILGEPTSVLLRRDCFDRFGSFNPSLKQRCDYEYWIRVGSHTGIALVAEKLASFRLHSDSTTSKNHANKQYITELGDYLLLLHEYAYADAFSALRLLACKQTPAIDFIGKLEQYADWVCKDLHAKERAGLLNSQEILSEITTSLSAYPRLTKLIRTKNRLLPITLWINRHLLWRFQ